MTGAKPGSEWLMVPAEPWRTEPGLHRSGLDRRSFLRVATAVGGGLLVCVTPSACRGTGGESGQDASESLNAYVQVDTEGWVQIQAPCPEIGQGVRTSLPMIVAGELGADWDRCVFRQAPAADSYGGMTVGGSDSVSDYWLPLRRAGAAARVLLEAAAARRLDVPVGELRVADGSIRHPATSRAVSFGDVATEAAGQAIPDPVPLRPEPLDPVGRATGPVHAEEVVRGTARYGIDLADENLLVAVVARPPVHGGSLVSMDDRAARAVDGVVDVVEIEPRVIGDVLYGAVRGGVAVVARDTWSAMRGRDSLVLEWDDGPHGSFSTDDLRRTLGAALAEPPELVLRSEGPSVDGVRGRRIERTYGTPLLAHACMEPVNFTADANDDRVVLRGPTQNPRSLQSVVAQGFGLEVERVEVYPTLAGGGFGRRLAFDYGVEAAYLSRSLGRPVKVVWSREDDLRHDYYRPPSAHSLTAVLGADGLPRAWRHHLATGSLMEHIRGAGAEPVAVYDVQGGADLPYELPGVEFAYSSVPVGVQLGSWRSVAHSFNVFVVECFMDELAEAADLDPLELRLRLLPGAGTAPISLPLPGRRGAPAPDRARLRSVLRDVARISSWSSDRVDGTGLGLACCYYKQTYVAHVAEVEPGDPPRVRRVHVAVDCGRVVNPDGVRAQCEGAVMDALATVRHWSVDVGRGRVAQSNFDDYPLIRIADAPDVRVSIASSAAAPSGMGEPPYPSAVAAIVNGIAAANGTRIRHLPAGEG